MKKLNFLQAFYFIFIFILISCNKDESQISNEKADYNSKISNQRVILAQSLIQAFGENPDMAEIAVRECYNYFDGDRNVLCKDLFNVSSSKLKSSDESFGNRLKKYLKISNLKSFNYSATTSLDEIIVNDSLTQLYLYVSSESIDSLRFSGVVVIPENFKENSGEMLLLIKNDGSQSLIDSYEEPRENFLVVSSNERVNKISDNVADTKESKLKSDYSVWKDMKITRASFTSIDAKRTFESWWAGEPEVRLTIIYAVRNSSTNQLSELRNTTFMYPESWVKVNTWKKNGVKWNNNEVMCPRWYFYEQSFERRLIWTEEDGKTKEQEIEQEVTEPTTGIKTKIKTKIPASDDQKTIADSYIDYYSPSAGEQRWGSIKFDLAF